MHDMPTRSDVERWLRHGAELFYDAALKQWTLHEKGISSCDGDVWRVPGRTASAMVQANVLEKVRDRVGGTQYQLIEVMRNA